MIRYFDGKRRNVVCLPRGWMPLSLFVLSNGSRLRLHNKVTVSARLSFSITAVYTRICKSKVYCLLCCVLQTNRNLQKPPDLLID